jgi:hypothetical protein
MTLIGKPKPLTTKDTKEHRGGSGERKNRRFLPLISPDDTDRKTKTFTTEDEGTQRRSGERKHEGTRRNRRIERDSSR